MTLFGMLWYLKALHSPFFNVYPSGMSRVVYVRTLDHGFLCNVYSVVNSLNDSISTIYREELILLPCTMLVDRRSGHTKGLYVEGVCYIDNLDCWATRASDDQKIALIILKHTLEMTLLIDNIC